MARLPFVKPESTASSPATICALCRAEAKLFDSHIMPKFFIRRVQHQKLTGKAGIPQPFLTVFSLKPTAKDGTKQTSKWENQLGLKEYLLCGACEGRFSKYEGYARKFFYGGGTGPLKKTAVGKFMEFEDPDMLGLRVVQPGDYDYKTLKLFQLSIIWRAAVASGDHFRNVTLDAAHEEKLRDMLNTENPGKPNEYCCPMVDLRFRDLGCEDFSQTPANGLDPFSGQNVYKIILGGYLYIFHVTNEQPTEEVLNMAVKPNGHWHIPVGNCEVILRMWGDAFRKSGKI